MNRIIEQITKPRYGLVWFDEYKDIGGWVEENFDDITKMGGIVIKTRNEIHFSNGNRLILGYGDPNRYIGMEFLFIYGTVDPILKSRVRV